MKGRHPKKRCAVWAWLALGCLLALGGGTACTAIADGPYADEPQGGELLPCCSELPPDQTDVECIPDGGQQELAGLPAKRCPNTNG